MPGPENRDRAGRSPNTSVRIGGGEIRPDRQAHSGGSKHKGKERLPDAIGTKKNCRRKAGFDPRKGEPERARRNRSADGSDAANPRPSAAPNGIRRQPRDSETAHRGREGIPWGNRAAPTTLVPGRTYGRFPAPPRL